MTFCSQENEAISYFILFILEGLAMLCLGWSRTHFVAKTGLKLTAILLLEPQVLRL